MNKILFKKFKKFSRNWNKKKYSRLILKNLIMEKKIFKSEFLKFIFLKDFFYLKYFRSLFEKSLIKFLITLSYSRSVLVSASLQRASPATPVPSKREAQRCRGKIRCNSAESQSQRRIRDLFPVGFITDKTANRVISSSRTEKLSAMKSDELTSMLRLRAHNFNKVGLLIKW